MQQHVSIDTMIAFEQGELDDISTVNMFAKLIKTGMAWQLQGFYGRTASALIENNIINQQGEINYEALDEISQNI
jgi:hypothetical protein